MKALICVCSPERLSQYKVLYASVKKYLPHVTPILYYGGKDLPSDVGEVVSIHEWVKASPYSDDWYTYTYLRPKVLLDVFSKGYESVILVGSDTEFFCVPYEILYPDEDPDCFVTMYTHEPYEDDVLYPNDTQILEVGQINADLIGFNNTPKVIKFLNWMHTTLSTKIVHNKKIYLDQGWFSMVFSFLDKVKIIRHSGYNVANYNLHNRGLKKTPNGVWKMKDQNPLVLFHYAGLQPGKEEQVSKHQNRYKAEGEILEFLKDYTRRTT